MSIPAYRDLFSWNRELFEDDWNDGKLYTIKLKNKGKGMVSDSLLTLVQDFGTTAKIGAEKDGKHAADFEQKVKVTVDDASGMECELKAKNNGTFSWTWESDALKVSDDCY